MQQVDYGLAARLHCKNYNKSQQGEQSQGLENNGLCERLRLDRKDIEVHEKSLEQGQEIEGDFRQDKIGTTKEETKIVSVMSVERHHLWKSWSEPSKTSN